MVRILMVFMFLFSFPFLLDGVWVSVHKRSRIWPARGTVGAGYCPHETRAQEVEYRFYDTQIVAYDETLEEPQWVVPYDCIKDISVESGLFGSPLWLPRQCLSSVSTVPLRTAS